MIMKMTRLIGKLFLIFCFAGALSACNDDKTDNEGDGGKNQEPPVEYPDKPGKAAVKAGDGRVLIEWAKGSDGSITGALITWENGNKTKEIDINGSSKNISVPIDGLTEGDYTFVVKTKNQDGLFSDPVELKTHVYGDQYRASLTARGIKTAYVSDGKLSLTWDGVTDTHMIKTTLIYTNGAGKETTRDIANTETEEMVIGDYKAKTELAYRSYFQPTEEYLDTFASADLKITPEVKVTDEYLDRSAWEIKASSEEPGQEPYGGGKASYLLDGLIIDSQGAPGDRVATYWHSSVSADFPHWIAVDMKEKVYISQLVLERRLNTDQDQYSANQFWFVNYSVWGSNDADCWTDAGGSDKWVSLGKYSVDPAVNGERVQYASVQAEKTYRYLKVVLIDSSRGVPYCHFSELGVIGTVESAE